MGGQYARIIGLIRGMHRGFCTLVLFMFLVFINGLLVAVEQARLGIELSDGRVTVCR